MEKVEEKQLEIEKINHGRKFCSSCIYHNPVEELYIVNGTHKCLRNGSLHGENYYCKNHTENGSIQYILALK